ncbi:MAG: hypothetical protein IJV41_01240 [Oscillospiraceae bacterium]|nr:hypothetical protein [Oscillospiraceae bacterium]
MPTNKLRDWREISAAYIERGMDERAVADAFGVAYCAVRSRSVREDWPGKRTAFLDQTRTAAMNRVADKLLGRIEQTLDESGSLDVKDLKAVTGALKELREWQSEGQKDTPTAAGPLTVRFMGETEELSR